jgi:hypothetical protein
LVAASHHRRPQVTVGAEATLEQTLLSLPGRLADLALRALNRFSTGGHRQAAAAGALWEPVGRGVAHGAAPLARPSLTMPLRRRLRRRAAVHRPARRRSPRVS